MLVSLTPGIYTKETDLSYFASAASTCMVGMVGTATKGPVNNPQLITTPDQFIRVFGYPTPDSYGTYGALEYLRNGNRLWYSRVGNNLENGGTPALALASALLPGAAAAGGINVYALTPGEWGNDVSVKVEAEDAVADTPASFTLRIYVKGSLKETFRKLNVIAGDANNVETRLGSYLSPGSYLTSPGASKYIVVSIVTAARAVPVATDNPVVLDGGESGLNPTDLEVVGAVADGARTGLQCFNNLEESDINVLVAPGFTSDAVATAMVNLCVSRGDCMAILDPPVALSVEEVVEAYDTSNPERAFLKSSYAAVYWPWVKINDELTGQRLLMPPSSYVVSQYAYNDKVGFPWLAPAGWTRGVMQSVSGVEYNASQSERDKLYGELSSVNPIITVLNQGTVIFGQKTMIQENSSLDRVNVRRMVLYLRKKISQISRTLLFEPNDPRTWDGFKALATPILDNVRAQRGLYNYRIKMDAETVNSDAIAANQMPGIIYLQPMETAEVITLDFTLIPTGANFNDY